MADFDQIRGKNVVAVIDFHESTVYLTDAAPGQKPEHVVATDPHGHFHKVHHHAGNVSGDFEADNAAYWRELTDALTPAGAIMLLGHGGGKANASHHLVSYIEKHRPELAAKLIADVRADIDHLTPAQVLEVAQYYFFAEAPMRDFGDSRWGKPEQ